MADPTQDIGHRFRLDDRRRLPEVSDCTTTCAVSQPGSPWLRREKSTAFPPGRICGLSTCSFVPTRTSSSGVPPLGGTPRIRSNLSSNTIPPSPQVIPDGFLVGVIAAGVPPLIGRRLSAPSRRRSWCQVETANTLTAASASRNANEPRTPVSAKSRGPRTAKMRHGPSERAQRRPPIGRWRRRQAGRRDRGRALRRGGA